MQEIEILIQNLAKLPGFGPRSARRAALHILKNKQKILKPLENSLTNAAKNVVDCEVCGNIDSQNPCQICTSTHRDESIISVVEKVSDLWALSKLNGFLGVFHVLGGALSPMDGITPNDLNIESLVLRAQKKSVKEIILATNLTVEGQSTAHYVAEKLQNY